MCWENKNEEQLLAKMPKNCQSNKTRSDFISLDPLNLPTLLYSRNESLGYLDMKYRYYNRLTFFQYSRLLPPPVAVLFSDLNPPPHQLLQFQPYPVLISLKFGLAPAVV